MLSLTRHELTVPNTNLVFLKGIDVHYLIANEDGTVKERELKGVKSDQMRLIASAQEVQDIEQGQRKAQEQEQPPSTDANTGLGGWQTVAVTTVDEEQERAEHEAAVEAMRRGDVSDEEVSHVVK